MTSVTKGWAYGPAHFRASSPGEQREPPKRRELVLPSPRRNAGHRRHLPHAGAGAGAPRRKTRKWLPPRARPSPQAESAGSEEEGTERDGAVRVAPRGPVGARRGLPEHRVAALRRVAVPLPGVPILHDPVQDGARPDALRLLLPPRLRRRHQYASSSSSSSLFVSLFSRVNLE